MEYSVKIIVQLLMHINSVAKIFNITFSHVNVAVNNIGLYSNMQHMCRGARYKSTMTFYARNDKKNQHSDIGLQFVVVLANYGMWASRHSSFVITVLHCQSSSLRFAVCFLFSK